MCYKHWRDKRLNPSGFRVVSREYPHEPVAMYKDLRCASPCPCHAGASQNAVSSSYISHCCVVMCQLQYSACSWSSSCGQLCLVAGAIVRQVKYWSTGMPKHVPCVLSLSDMEGLTCHGCKVAICQAAHGFAGEAPVQQTMWTFWGTWM